MKIIAPAPMAIAYIWKTQRCEAHEPAVVAQVLVGLPLRRLGALVRNHLRRAGLARHVVAGHARAAAGARAVDDEPESVADRLDRLGLQRHLRLGTGRRRRL